MSKVPPPEVETLPPRESLATTLNNIGALRRAADGDYEPPVLRTPEPRAPRFTVIQGGRT